jgi:hypothetical protein
MRKLLAAILMVPAMAHAEFYSGNILLQKINSSELHDKALAIGYIMGVSDAFQNAEHCSPNTVTSGQTRDVVKLYLEQSPSIRDMTADVLVRIALSNAWPCANKQKNGKKI